jgi:hypothetical protein
MVITLQVSHYTLYIYIYINLLGEELGEVEEELGKVVLGLRWIEVQTREKKRQ